MADDKAAMSSYKAQVEQYGTPISEDQYKALRNYAEQNGVKLSGFKDFVGDIRLFRLSLMISSKSQKTFRKS